MTRGINPRELAAFLAGQYADASWSRTDHYSWIAGLVLELGVASLAELGEVVREVDESPPGADGLPLPAGAVRRLDDALLWVFGERYVALHQHTQRAGLLRHRLERLRGRHHLTSSELEARGHGRRLRPFVQHAHQQHEQH